MTIEKKIFFTVVFVIGAFVLQLVMRWNARSLKRSIAKRNPMLLDQAEWFFSEKWNVLSKWMTYVAVAAFVIIMWVYDLPIE